jgi:putative ABC transport system permease protein
MKAWQRYLPARMNTDFRVAMRGLRRTPAFTIATIAILAVGIGTAAAVSTVYKIVLVDRLPVVAQDRIVVMNPLDKRRTHLDPPYSYLSEIARDTTVFRAVGGVYHKGAEPAPFIIGNTSIQLGTVTASPNYFDVFGVRPALGRLFRPEDGQAGAPPVIVLSFGAWQRQFGGDPSVLGKSLLMPYEEKRARIVGVAPPGFEYPAGADVWVPWPADTSLQMLQVDIVARLARDATPTTARSALLAMWRRRNPFAYVGPQLPIEQYGIAGVAVQLFADTVLGNSRPALIGLMWSVGLLLLITCLNVGGLFLVRLLARAREIAIRRAIGASYTDVFRLFAIESTVLAVFGCALGIATAAALIRTAALFAPAQLARRDALAIVGPPLATTAVISLLAVFIFGLAPSLMAARVSSLAILRADSRSGTAGRSSHRLRRLLVTTQMSLAVVLLAAAGLVVRSLAALTSMDLGYQQRHLSILSFTGPRTTLGTNAQIFDAARRLTARLETVPGVVAASPVESMPFRGQSLFIMRLASADQPVAERSQNSFVPFEFVGADYFRTFDIPIRRGRGFLATDTKSSGNVVVINETFARQLWPNQDAVGRRLVQTINNSEWTVVGVASDTHFRELKQVGPIAYFDWEQISPFWNGFIAVRTTAELSAVLPALRAATRDVDPNLILFAAETMDQLLDAPFAQPRLSAALLSGFSVAALLLSAIGLYGVLSSAVRQQTRDIGVRVALGATPGHIRQLVLGDALSVVCAGAVIGIAGALMAGRIVESQLFGVGAIDPIAIGSAAGLLVLIGGVAAYAPARRATRIDPVQALRSD